MNSGHVYVQTKSIDKLYIKVQQHSVK